MLTKELRDMFNECEEFIDKASPEELLAYEESLNLDYESYSNGIDFSGFIDLNCRMRPMKKMTYCVLTAAPKTDSKENLNGNFAYAA